MRIEKPTIYNHIYSSSAEETRFVAVEEWTRSRFNGRKHCAMSAKQVKQQHLLLHSFAALSFTFFQK